jgi:hypothetical protein
MLTVYEKAMESVEKTNLSAFIVENNILIEQKSGFRKSHSCETSLNLVLIQWKEEIDKGKVVIGVLLDLKRANETIDRNLLLRKFVEKTVYGTTKINGTEAIWNIGFSLRVSTENILSSEV